MIKMNKKEMTARERILAAINHEEPDRIPIDFGSSHVTTIHSIPYKKLIKHFNFNSKYKIAHKMLQVVIPSEELIKRFNSDTRGVFLDPPDKFKDFTCGKNCYKDQWGITRQKPKNSYYYDQVTPVPLGKEDLTKKEIDYYDWPDPDDPGRYKNLRNKAIKQKEKGDYALVLNFGASFLHRTQYLRSMKQWYEDIIMRPEILGYLMDKVLDYYLKLGKHVFNQIGDLIDVVAIGDDLGTQNNLQISPSHFRTIIKPRYKRLINFINQETEAFIKFHSCGSIYSIIEDLIDIGVDILNPVQTTAKNMEADKLKDEFGDRLTFWGAIDTQFVLPNGGRVEVEEEVKSKINSLGVGGGYILATVNNIQPDVRIQNIITAFEAANKFGRYPLN